MEDFVHTLKSRVRGPIESAIYADDLVLVFHESLTNDVLDNL